MVNRVVHVVPSLASGGINSFVQSIAPLASSYGYCFDVVAFKDGPGADRVVSSGGSVFFIPLVSKAGLWGHFWQIVQIIRTGAPCGVIHFHRGYSDLVAMIAACVCGVKKRIVHSHTTALERRSHRYIYALLSRLIALLATDLVACSHDAGIFAFGGRTFKIARNVVNAKKIIADTEVVDWSKYGIDQESLKIVAVGRLSEVKNHKFLLKISKELRAASIKHVVVIVGDGQLRSEIENHVAELGLGDSVYLAGESADVPSWLRASDCFVMPSLYEGVPMAALEAQLVGIPCFLSANISQDVDLGFGNTSFLKLEDGPSEWARVIAGPGVRIKISRDTIVSKLDGLMFDPKFTMDVLNQIYG